MSLYKTLQITHYTKDSVIHRIWICDKYTGRN